MNSRLFSFVGGSTGPWRIIHLKAVVGESLPSVPYLNILPGSVNHEEGEWVLRGVTSNERYVTCEEKSELISKQEGLGRPNSSSAALIPIKKSEAWWALTQEERRSIFEEQSAHIRTGIRYLPAIARRLHHCRDLGTDEPFDFLTWFEYSPEEVGAFNELLAALRASEEWRFVTREVDIRLKRASD